jgi:hypothetical protein
MEASEASSAPSVGSLCILGLFPPGFVGSAKWFHPGPETILEPAAHGTGQAILDREI